MPGRACGQSLVRLTLCDCSLSWRPTWPGSGANRGGSYCWCPAGVCTPTPKSCATPSGLAPSQIRYQGRCSVVTTSQATTGSTTPADSGGARTLPATCATSGPSAFGPAWATRQRAELRRAGERDRASPRPRAPLHRPQPPPQRGSQPGLDPPGQHPTAVLGAPDDVVLGRVDPLVGRAVAH